MYGIKKVEAKEEAERANNVCREEQNETIDGTCT
jgi:hypothetical protein